MIHADSSQTSFPAPCRRHRWLRAIVIAVTVIVLVPAWSYAQASPWENAVNVLMTSFTGHRTWPESRLDSWSAA